RAPSCLACTASSARYTLSLHDALPIWTRRAARWQFGAVEQVTDRVRAFLCDVHVRGLVPAGRHVAGGEVLMTWLLAVMLLPLLEIGRAHVCTPVTFRPRMPSSA